ncbi:D-lactate dehydrogenase-like protein 2 [Lentithecium fluviatile CBS 122367]|uniref:D-lactate dehydrogenase (cytochrome) n=1 Tax=Lentithecium fluviatile CBS 122367 TaxID=1168545 RepID=A0A6G1J4B6_9PLEO|nr:D-lactate dehydrogenase-like protein 2 [Lentithecium fluviatile CBS 122367]
MASATSEPHQPDAEGDLNGAPAPAKTIKFTSETYPEIKRNSKFAKLSQEHMQYFQELLGSGSAVLDGLSKDASEDIEPYNSDWMRKYRGHAKLVLKPGSTEEVSKILKYCNDNMLAVVPQGGNTGLVGGSVPVFDEIVINLQRMDKIRSFDEVSGILVADAGVILEVADNFLAEKKHIFPLDLGAKGSCQIGGNVATNAGGLRLLRYGSLHGNVLGIEAVLPDGTVVDDLLTLRKNNTGYDLKHLFIGGEGTIGIITGISILCPQRSAAVNVAYFGLESYEHAQKAFRAAKNQLSEILSAFEMMDGRTQKLLRTGAGKKLPLEGDHPFYCLIETSGSNTDHDSEKLQNFLEHVMEAEIVSDGVLAQDQTQIADLWSCREGVPEILGHWGGVYKYDLSLPIADLYDIVNDVRDRLTNAGLVGDDDSHPCIDVVGYGHMGDANLHLNIPVRRYDKEVEKQLEPFVYEWVQKKSGSISAEHGLGIAKKPYIGYSRSDTMIKLMRQIKDLYDPKGIMNPYKYI